MVNAPRSLKETHLLIQDITGNRSGRLTALRCIGVNKGRFAVWLCFCECGGTAEVTSGNFNISAVKSCGCLQLERIAEANRKLKTIHGQARKNQNTTEYMAFGSAKQRCYNKKDKDYENYGGRGIEVKFKNFEEFFAELGPRPKHYVLDRIDNNGHYEKGNVRWTTLSESNLDKRQPKRGQNGTFIRAKRFR